MAINNKTINDVFQPTVNGFLGIGSAGATYTGMSIIIYLSTLSNDDLNFM